MTYNLAQLIEHSAIRCPDNDAFKCLDDSISYAELNIKASKLAFSLLKGGVVKGDRVAIYMNRCLETAVAVYGILKSGAAFVVIDPFSPKIRALAIMKDCGIKHLITTNSMSNKVANISKEAPFLKSIIGVSKEMETTTISWETVFANALEKFQPPEILAQDLASILYTSGSTGTPKGIMHTHYSLLNLAILEADLHDSNENDIIGNFAPLHFDQSLFGYFSGPLVGAKTVIFPDAYVKLPASLAKLVAQEKITLWFSVPLILSQLLTHGQIDKHDFSSLRWVRFGGEVFPVKQLRELMQKWPHAKFINSYGPSEIARCTYYILDKPPKTDAPIPLGTVWKNTEYLIIDKNNDEVKKEEPGELVVRTATMMSGYWNNKELTEKSLLRKPVAAGFDYVFYKTGDLVRENDKNELLFLGRIDRQIKLRGFRIELGEIEAVLLKNKFVEEASAIIVEKKELKEIVVMVRLIANASMKPIDLQKYIKERLPKYAIPHEIIISENMPRTANGKVDLSKIKELLETKQK